MCTCSLKQTFKNWRCKATQEYPKIVWNPKVHYRVYNSLPLVSILSQINPVHTTSSSLSKIILISSRLRLGLPSVIFLRFPHQNSLCIPLLPMCATCPAHAIFIDLILITLSEEYKLWSSSLFNFLQPHIISSLFSPNIILSTLFTNTLSLYSPLIVRDQVSLPHKNATKYMFSHGETAEMRNICYYFSSLYSNDYVSRKGIDTCSSWNCLL
jgi:hypothetical protein